MIGVLPASVVAIGAGLAFLLSAAGTLVGAWAAFQLSRSLLRPMVARFLKDRGRAARFDDAVVRDGWRFVFLLRISPVMLTLSRSSKTSSK